MSIKKLYGTLRITKTENAIPQMTCLSFALSTLFQFILVCEACAQFSFMSHPGSEEVIVSDKKK